MSEKDDLDKLVLGFLSELNLLDRSLRSDSNANPADGGTETEPRPETPGRNAPLREPGGVRNIDILLMHNAGRRQARNPEKEILSPSTPGSGSAAASTDPG